MQNLHSPLIELHVPLNQDEDRFPVVANEALVCERVGANYRVAEPPLFLRGLAVDDILEVTLVNEDWVESWQIVRRSGSSTIWLLLQSVEAQDAVTRALAELRTLGCESSALLDYGRYAISVPQRTPIVKVDEILGGLNDTPSNSDVAIAYPAFRHDET